MLAQWLSGAEDQAGRLAQLDPPKIAATEGLQRSSRANLVGGRVSSHGSFALGHSQFSEIWMSSLSFVNVL